jgi:hypothetical protein
MLEAAKLWRDASGTDSALSCLLVFSEKPVLKQGISLSHFVKL